MQHELFPRVALTGDYYFRYNGNQLVRDNTLITKADFDGPFCITAPSSPDLPNGGGYPVCGLYDIKPASRSLQQNNTTFARNFGGIVDHYMGYDVTLSARLANGTILQGGLNAQRRVYDTCNATILSGTTTPNQVDNPEARFCHQELPSRPDFKMLATFNLPLSLIVSGTYQISSGPMVTATWAAPNALIAAPSALGRNLAAGATATKSIQLIEPGSSVRRLSESARSALVETLVVWTLPGSRRRQSLQRLQQRLRELDQYDVLDDRQQSVPAADCRPGGPLVQDRRTGGFLNGEM